MERISNYLPDSKAIAGWTAFIILFMSFWTFVELLFLSHYEDRWQIFPLAVLASVFVLTVIVWLKNSRRIQRIFLLLLGVCIISGLLGVYFHLAANVEFEAELRPSQSSLTTFLKSFHGALPALAPGSMIVLGLIGFLYLILINKLSQK